MKTLKAITPKTSTKQEREKRILLGLIEHHLKTGKPVGSNTLKEAGFDDLSSATIRNYFAHLEEEGYLVQQHSSGGRIPTARAYRFYAQEFISQDTIPIPIDKAILSNLRNAETREIAAYLQGAAETLSQQTNCAVFLSAPRFDQDFILDIKLVSIDQARCLCILITNFGVIQTEVLPTEKKLSAFSVKRLESYFHWRLTGNDKPENLTSDEEQFAHKCYNELIVRFIIGYSNFTNEAIYCTGFSKLLNYPEFQNPLALANSLALFENVHSMRLLLKECMTLNHLKFWIGDDLAPFTNDESPECAIVGIPYYINHQPVGSIGLLGTMRMPYRQLFTILRAFSESISTALTRSIYKHKISFRQPKSEALHLQKEEYLTLGQTRLILLEDKRYLM